MRRTFIFSHQLHLLIVTLLCLVFSNGALASWNWSYVWNSTKYFFDSQEGYKAIEDLHVIDDLDKCSDLATKKQVLSKKSLFQIPTPTDKYKQDKEWIIDVTYVNGTDSNNLGTGLYKFCLKDDDDAYNQEHRYSRIGGMTSGILVVPYKWRKSKNEFSGEATIGPYWGFKNELFTLAISAGLSQIGVQSETTNEIEYETGFSYSTGLIYSMSETFDIALIVGKDRLFGDDADNFEHQNKTWISFAIGYKFTK